MKKLAFLILLTFVGTVGYAQEVPPKSNTIVITMPDSNDLFKNVMKVLSDKGYTVKPKNTDNKFKLTTEPKTLKNTRLTLIISIKGSEVFLKGKIFIAGQENLNLEYKGAKGTPIMTAWEEMDKVAKAFKMKMRYEKN